MVTRGNILAVARRQLSPRERVFVELYTSGETSGNAARSAEGAGFSASSSAVLRKAGSQLVRRPGVVAAIQERVEQQLARQPMLRDRRQRMKWLADVAQRLALPDAEPAIRLRAHELLMKAAGDFVNRVEVDDRTEIGTSQLD